MVSGSKIIHLQHGLWLEGKRCKEVELNYLTGFDQENLKKGGNFKNQARWITLLLSLCVKRIGQIQTVTPELIQKLTVGDREALLLHIRHMTFGNKLNSVINCPNEECKEKIGLDVKVKDLLLPLNEKAKEFHSVKITYKGTCYNIEFRLPNGQDLESLTDAAVNENSPANKKLIQACILKVNIGNKEHSGELPMYVFNKISQKMGKLDPLAVIEFEIKCPECSKVFNTILDTGHFLQNELNQGIVELYHEIHLLAYHYNWSEKDILAMHLNKRRMYCNMILNNIPEEAT